MIKKILVAIDGSKSSDKALEFALDLAQKYVAQVVLINVFDTSSFLYLTSPSLISTPIIPTEQIEERRILHSNMLSKALKKARNSNKDLKISKKLVKGRPADRIIEVAKEDGFDLIVIGSRGFGVIKEVFLGSVSHRVADRASCPVLIVREK